MYHEIYTLENLFMRYLSKIGNKTSFFLSFLNKTIDGGFPGGILFQSIN